MLDVLINALQWPALVTTLISTWLVSSTTKKNRNLGFWCFITSNIMWILWGWHVGAYALVMMQIGLVFLNLRGTFKN
ncbi:MAG: hypothetical protein H7Z70_03730 [Bacteroidia bacterium]|nr:hypothetical protein [Methylotenera sp.]